MDIATTKLFDSLGKGDNKSILAALIKAGENVKREKHSVLHYASQFGCLEVVKFLWERRVDINASNFDGYTPLHIASLCGRMEIVRYLLRKGANLEKKSLSGLTALLFAIKGKHQDIANVLIKVGANVNCCNYQKLTALHYASIFSCAEVIGPLVKKGAVLNAKILYGTTTPLYLAMHNKSINCTERLLQLGADCNMECLNSVTIFSNFIEIWPNVKVVRLCIEHGAYLKPSDYYTITENSTLKESILQDVKICSQAIINKFNNLDLPELYKIPMCIERLPPIDKLKIMTNRAIRKDIEKTVKYDIETKGDCNLLTISPMALTLLCVESLNKYYEGINNQLMTPSKRLKR